MNRHKQIAKQVLPLIDLTRLNQPDDQSAILDLCHKAKTQHGQVAAVCIYPEFIDLAVKQLQLSGISIATVVNFPEGDQSLEAVCQTIRDATTRGATEIDVVMPYQDYLEGNTSQVCAFIKSCKTACENRALLKVILETGIFETAELIEQAAIDMINSGADFLKTSTGKIQVGATTLAARAMCQAIFDHYQATGKKIGIKFSGGIRFLAQTLPFLAIIDEILTEDWLHPDTCRFGASSLLDDVLGQL